MTHSINYYIQLSDELSTMIDNASKKQLADLAHQVMSNWHVLETVEYRNFEEVDYAAKVAKSYGFTENRQMLQLAHGLLAKAV